MGVPGCPTPPCPDERLLQGLHSRDLCPRAGATRAKGEGNGLSRCEDGNPSRTGLALLCRPSGRREPRPYAALRAPRPEGTSEGRPLRNRKGRWLALLHRQEGQCLQGEDEAVA